MVNGVSYPCVHEHWFRKGIYHDPNAYRETPKKWDELIDAIKEQKCVVLTSDKVIDERTSFQRTGYIALFEVDDVSLDGFDLKFRMIKRLAELT